MKIKAITAIKTRGEARQQAIELQKWQSKKSMSYSEILGWQEYLKILAKKFNLKKEFKENGII